MRSTAVTTPSSFVTFRRIAVAGCLAGTSVLALGSSAFAQTTTTPGSTTTATNTAKSGRPSLLTTEQRACLASKGFGPKSKPAAGSAPATKTQKTEAERTAERTAREAAAKACGVTLPTGGRGGHGADGDGAGRGPGGKGGPALTADQQSCLTAKGFAKPAAPVAGSTATKPPAPTAAQRTAREAAAKACGITLPVAGGHGGHGAGGARGQRAGQSANATTATTIKA